jgi:molybdenum cofactor cytidylyltransferase
MADLDGIPLGAHIARTLAPMSFGWRFAVCQKGAALAWNFEALNFDIIENAAPETGQAHSLHLAVAAAERTAAKALLVTLADMPFVSQSHLVAIAKSAGLTASSNGRVSMPPALFPRAFWPSLHAAEGDQGARLLLRQARLLLAPSEELRDIDLAGDLPTAQGQ